MTTQLYVAFGVGLISFILLYIAFKIDFETHWFLQLVLIGIVIHLGLLVPATFVTLNEECYPVVNTSTTVGATTSYTYDDYCNTKDITTPTSFYKGYLWVIRLFWIYAVIYGLKILSDYLRGRKK